MIEELPSNLLTIAPGETITLRVQVSNQHDFVEYFVVVNRQFLSPGLGQTGGLAGALNLRATYPSNARS